MPEFLAEASVLIRPNTDGFRQTLIAALTKATAGIVVPIPVVAVARGTQSVKELNATRTKQIIIDREAAVAETNLAEAQKLTVIAQAKVIAVEKAGAESTTALAIARSKLKAANLAVAASMKAVDASLLAGAESEQLLAVEALRAATALQIEAVAAKKSAVATTEGVAAHAQFTRGITAESLALGNIRGATLAASKGFLLGAAAVTVTAKTIQAFSREAESAARVTKVFGEDAGAELERSAKGMANSLGLSAEAALKYEGAIGEVFKNVQVAADENARFSESLVRVAADSAAFNNVPVTEVLRAIQLALSGNLRGLRQFIPGVTAASIQLQALADTGKKTVAELTQQNLVVARAEQIQKLAANQAGTFADRQSDLAAQSKILRSNLENLAATIGGPLSKAVTAIVFDINELFLGFKKISGLDPFGQSGKFQSILAFKDATDKLRGSLNLIDDAMHATVTLLGPIGTVGTAFQGLVGPIGAVGNAAEETSRQLAGLKNHMLDLEIRGASPAERIANLRAQIEKDRAIIAHPGKGGAAAQTRAKEDIIANQREIASIIAEQNQQAAANKAAADSARQQARSAAQAAASAAQQALDDQDQALLTQQQLAQGRVDIAKAHAANTKPLADDLAADRVQVALLDKQIVEAAKIHDRTLRLQTIQSLTLARVNAQAQLAADEEAQRQAIIDHRNLVRDRKGQRIDLDIQIAETNKNIAAEIAARQAKIRFDQEQIRSVHGDLVRKKQLQLDIAQQNAAIRALKHTVTDRNKESQELAFAFLQEQSGFASSILSNLLPTGSVAGTVGGTSTGISTPTIPSPVAAGGPQRPPDVGAGLGKAAAVGARGSTAGQMASLIQIQRHMLTVLLRLAGQNTHPESTTHRAWSWAQNLSTGW